MNDVLGYIGSQREWNVLKYKQGMKISAITPSPYKRSINKRTLLSTKYTI